MLNTTEAPVVETHRMTLLWLPSFTVASVMLTFLAVSFTRHLRRVRRKKQIMWDYMRLHLHVKRCRISANLCNTYSIPLRQLASSVRMHLMDEPVRRSSLHRAGGAVAMRSRLKQKGTFGDTLSPDEDDMLVDSLDWNDSVQIRMDLLCDRCREHVGMKPIFYISEDSQSVVLSDMNGSQVIGNHSTDTKLHGTPKRVPNGRTSRLSSNNYSLASEDETDLYRRIQRVPTVTVTDMSDVEMESFQHDTVSLDSLCMSNESMSNCGKPKAKTKVLLSAEDAADCYDVMSRDPDEADRRQPLIVTGSLPCEANKNNKHREFLKFFSKRKRRKLSRKSKKPVLTKQDRIVPGTDGVSKSMDDLMKNSFERNDENLSEKRKLFAGKKTRDHPTVIDIEPKPEVQGQKRVVMKARSIDGSIHRGTQLNVYNTYLHRNQTDKRHLYQDIIRGRFQTRSHDNEGVETKPLQYGEHGGNRPESFDSSLKDHYLKLPSFNSPVDGKVIT